jgi:hypothetical protein
MNNTSNKSMKTNRRFDISVQAYGMFQRAVIAIPMICKSYGRNWGLAGHNQRAAGNAGIPPWLQIGDPWPAVPEQIRSLFQNY